MLSKIADDTLEKINGSEYLENLKLFLYSAHDINLASLLITLGLYDYSYGTPPYGSYAVFEVHQLGAADYGIQVSVPCRNFSVVDIQLDFRFIFKTIRA